MTATMTRSILVVDDEEDIRDVTRLLLANAGHRVTCAEDGDQAIREAGKHDFDVVITDLLMPEKDGVETIRELHKRYPHLRIIAMSGGGHVPKESYLKMAHTFGAHALLPKPFTRDELLRIVDLVCAAVDNPPAN